MKSFVSYFRDAFGAALVVGLVWYFGNAYTQVKGQGWFDRQSFPLNNITFCVVGGAVIGVFGAYVPNYLRDCRRQAMQSAAMFNQLNFEPRIQKEQLGSARSLRLLDNWDEGRNWMHGTFQGVDISIFDLHKKIVTYSRSSSSSSSTTRLEQQTVFLLKRPEAGGIVAQFLRKSSLGLAFQVFDFRGVEFDPRDATASDDDQPIISEFNRKYLVTQGLTRAGIKTSPLVTPDDVLLTSLEGLVDKTVIRKLLSDQNWDIELGDTHVAIWRHKERIRPTVIPDLLPQIRDIFGLFCNGSKMRGAAQLTARGASVLSRETAVGQFGLIAASGCLGAVLSAAVFGSLFFMYAEDYPWMVFAWPIVGMGTVVGAIKLALFIKRRTTG